MWREYLFPKSVDQTLEWLTRYKGDARIIAGGTDLVLQSKEGRCPSTVMVDITRIPGLSEIQEQDGYIRIGALATHGQVAASSLIQEKAGPLAQACGAVGGPQIRNMGTLVGNVVTALPAADGAVALFALDAEAEVASPAGCRWEQISQVYEAVGFALSIPAPRWSRRSAFAPWRRTITLPTGASPSDVPWPCPLSTWRWSRRCWRAL